MSNPTIEEQEENREAIEYRDMLLELKAVLSTSSGVKFIKYLLKSFDVGELPAEGVEGNPLYETLGFLRAGKSLFDIISHANPTAAATMLADIRGEIHAKTTRLNTVTEPVQDGPDYGL